MRHMESLSLPPSNEDVIWEAVQKVEHPVFTRAAVMEVLVEQGDDRTFTLGMVTKQLTVMCRKGKLEHLGSFGNHQGATYRKASE